MKTIKFLGEVSLLFVFFIAGCSINKTDPTNPNQPCTECNTHLPYELSVETYSTSNGFHLSTAMLLGAVTYPVTVKWYIKYPEYRKLNKTDTLASSQENKSFYQYNASDVNGNFHLECDATMANGVTLSKSTAH